MNIYYCDRCGKRIPESDVESGSVQLMDEDTHAVCLECNPPRRTTTATRTAMAQRSTGTLPRIRMSSAQLSPARKTTSSLPSPAAISEARASQSRRGQAGASGQQKVLIFAGVAIGVVCLIVGILVVGGKNKPGKTASKETTQTSSIPLPALPSRLELPPALPGKTASNSTTGLSTSSTEGDGYDPRAWTATSLLNEAKRFATEKPDDQFGYRDKLQSIVDRYSGTPAAEEAQKLLAAVVIRRDDRLPREDAWANAVDLFKIISTDRDSLQGTYAFKDGLLTCQPAGDKWARLRVPYRPPDEYDLKLSFKRLSGDECLVVGLSNQGHPFCFMAAGWKNTKAGFEKVKGERIPEGRFTLTRPPILLNDKRYELILQVRRNALRAFLNGIHLVSAEAFPDDLAASPSWDFPYPGERGLGLGSIGPYEFYEMRLLPISGEGKEIDRSVLAEAAKQEEKKPPAETTEPAPTPAAKPTAQPPAKLDVVLEFDFGNGSAMGWAAQKGLESFAFQDGALVTKTTEADAYMELGNLRFDTSLVTHLSFRLKSDKTGETQVYYTTSTGPKPDKNDVGSVRTQGDGQWHEYTVKLAGLQGFGGELRALRLDPVNGDTSVGAKVELKWIRLLHAAE